MEVFPAALRAELWEPGFVAEPAPAWELLGAAGGAASRASSASTCARTCPATCC